jgi:putative transposase
MRYRFIHTHHGEFDIKTMCRTLEVSRSGYYAWRSRQPSRRSQANQQLVEEIRQVHQTSRQTYGSPRVHAELKARGIECNHKRVARLMHVHGIQAKQRRRYKITTRANPRRPVAENLLKRDFTAGRPNQKWVADITYVSTHDGWLYLATVLDIFSRKIVGWSMSDRLKTNLVEDALQMALDRRQPQPGLLHHSDRGSQYTSIDYQALLERHHIRVSMSGTGNAYDNAMMESFFATLKTECVDRRYATRTEARLAIFEYLEVFYNNQRRHSSLGYLSPVAFERLHLPIISVSTKWGEVQILSREFVGTVEFVVSTRIRLSEFFPDCISRRRWSVCRVF